MTPRVLLIALLALVARPGLAQEAPVPRPPAASEPQDTEAPTEAPAEAPAEAPSEAPAEAPKEAEGATPAQPGKEGAAAEEDEALERYRTPFDVLNERMIGSASKSVRFDWRKTKVGVGLVGSELLERNNFGSTRLGGFARMPIGAFVGEVALTRVFTWDTDSTRKLALTPYRQYGRPSRFELDVNVGLPLAEGVVTAWPKFFPATELVVSATAGFRYLFYPGALAGSDFLDAAASVVAPRLSERELENLEKSRPGGMQVDSARYGLLAGLSTDLYFQTGGFITPRVLLAVPLLTPVNGTGLGWWWELSLGMGWAF